MKGWGRGADAGFVLARFASFVARQSTLRDALNHLGIFFSLGCRETCRSSDFDTIPFSTHAFRTLSGITRSDIVSVTDERARPIFFAMSSCV